MASKLHRPGKPAPMGGHFQEFNAAGAATGKIFFVSEGQPLPSAPPGCTWRPVRPLSERSAAELRAQAAEFHRMAETATTLPVMTGLRKLAERLYAKADEREMEEDEL